MSPEPTVTVDHVEEWRDVYATVSGADPTKSPLRRTEVAPDHVHITYYRRDAGEWDMHRVRLYGERLDAAARNVTSPKDHIEYSTWEQLPSWLDRVVTDQLPGDGGL